MNGDAFREPLLALGREAARQQDERLGVEPSPEACAAFQRGLAQRAGQAKAGERTRLRRPAAVGAGLLVAAAVAAVVLLWPRPAPTMSFRVREEPGQVGAWLAPTSDLPLVFSDGTSLTLDRNSVAKVTAVTATGAEVVISEGRVRAAVVHTTKSRWIMNVGPFAVHVTGTRFDASWNTRDRIFALELHEGSVVVDGCEIAPQAVRAGSSVRVRCEAGRGEVESPVETPAVVERPADPGPPEQQPAASADVTGVHPAVAAVPDGPRDTPSRSAPTWRELAAKGNSRAALAAALDHFDEECQHDSAADVMLLADQARYAGDATHARAALLAVRSRFASSSHAATAAFLLGRLAFDARSFGDASKWFEQAAVEAPNGPLARENAGRLIEARENAGDHAAARAAAQRYLQRYPSGPDASLAIRMLQP
jgi:ferric-dicitrate binding protein FerR (iron transport regulator)/TolA-binding protein